MADPRIAPWLMDVGDEARKWAADVDEARNDAQRQYMAVRKDIGLALFDIATWLRIRYGCEATPITTKDDGVVICSDGIKFALDRTYWPYAHVIEEFVVKIELVGYASYPNKITRYLKLNISYGMSSICDDNLYLDRDENPEVISTASVKEKLAKLLKVFTNQYPPRFGSAADSVPPAKEQSNSSSSSRSSARDFPRGDLRPEEVREKYIPRYHCGGCGGSGCADCRGTGLLKADKEAWMPHKQTRTPF